jgi:HK97 gp10 family phage protein
MARSRGIWSLTVTLKGAKELEKQLKELAKKSTATKYLRRAATAAIRPMRKACKAECPVDTGALKKSIDSKVSVKNYGVSAIVGSDTAVMDDKKKEGKGTESVVRAARILHLVLFGHITESGTAVPGNNFLEKGYHDAIDQTLSTYSAKLKEGIEKAVDEAKG